METSLIIFNIIQGAVILYFAFIQSYINEKGKNLATKQDINEITRITEKVRTDLLFSLQNRTLLNELNKNSIIEFYQNYYQWQQSITSDTFEHLKGFNNIQLQAIIDRTYNAYSTLIFSKAKIQFFIENEELKKNASELIEKTNLLCSEIVKELCKIKSTNNDIDEFIATGGVLNEHPSQYDIYSERKDSIINQLIKRKIDFQQNIINPINDSFISKANSYFKTKNL